MVGYRIRSAEELAKDGGGDVQLKKETKALRDFESALLKAYKMFLVVLQERIAEGLGADCTKPVTEVRSEAFGWMDGCMYDNCTVWMYGCSFICMYV